MRIASPRPNGLHESLTDRLAREVLRLIEDEDLGPGARIPSVRELAERFSVAAPTMREALTLLQMAGNLDIRHGSGIYVRSPETRLVLTNPYGTNLDSSTILQLLEARRIIEPRTAAMAAELASEEQLQGLADVLAEAEQHLASGDHARRDLDMVSATMRFHRGIADAAGNRVLAEVVHTLTELRVKEQLIVLDVYDDPVRDHQQHRDIYAALAARDPVAAEERMRDHLDEVGLVVRRRLEAGA